MSAASYEYKIDASIDRVWTALSESSEYDNWNPFIVKATGHMEQGRELDMTCVTDSGKMFRGVVNVVANDHQNRIAWNMRSPVPGFRNWNVDLSVSENGGQGTALKVDTEVSGFFAKVMGPRIEDIESGFSRMAQALNKHLGGASMPQQEQAA